MEEGCFFKENKKTGYGVIMNNCLEEKQGQTEVHSNR